MIGYVPLLQRVPEVMVQQKGIVPSLAKCDLQLAVSWVVSAKTSLQNVHSFSPNQLGFGKNPK